MEFLNSNNSWAGSFNGDLAGGIWKWSDFSLSQDEISNESNFKIYPNPVNNILNIDSVNEIHSIIYDITGKRVLESYSKNINIEKLVKGIYVIKIKDLVNNITESIKIIKK
ncbi:MAG: T9SS type A sorting domain-containing protein [Flavobacteriales bacterium]|nr:T9SS type A sorting domain-containing protein [Flavobacteriales bacterium]